MKDKLLLLCPFEFVGGDKIKVTLNIPFVAGFVAGLFAAWLS